ncbi:MAG: putative heme-binding domain-containing protein [Pirellulaceae bacterium]
MFLRNTIIGGIGFLFLLTCEGRAFCDQPVQWIWNTEDRETKQAVIFSKRIDLTGCSHPRLELATDFCEVTVEINGHEAARGYPYQTRRAIDLPKIAAGQWTILLHATPTGGPAALAARLTWQDRDGKRQFLSADNSWRCRIQDEAKTTSEWNRAVALGIVEDTIWNPDEGRVRISRFDDYEQWKQALGDDASDSPLMYDIQDGFELKRLRAAGPDEGSWVSLTFDPQGRAIIAREDQGLLRLSLPELKIEVVDDTLKECRGLQFVGNTLYAQANNSKAFYRLRDADGDGTFEDIQQLYETPGGVGHGRNDLAVAPQNSLYAIHGDSVDIPRNLTDLTSPFREHRRGKSSREGFVLHVDGDGANRQVVTAGLRNPYGIAVNKFGDVFTYDADAEYDMGAPWYRPTRMNHLLTGGDYGWRGVTKSWPSYYPDQPDFAPPTLDIGKGSPTAIAFGSASKFPRRYRDALYILDWAYGRVLAIHMTPRGTSYTCRAETFLKGRPLNVTDIAFGPGGAMYITTGGRKTKSALYRIRYVGPNSPSAANTKQAAARDIHAEQQRALRLRLVQSLPDPSKTSIADIWTLQGHADPNIRYLAKCLIERMPVEQWKDMSLTERNVVIAMSGLLALARSNSASTEAIIARVCSFDIAEQRVELQIEAARIVDLCLQQEGKLAPSQQAALVKLLGPLYPASDIKLNRSLSLLLTQLDSADFVTKTLAAIPTVQSQEERMQLLYALRHHKQGWTSSLREAYFAHLRAMTAFRGGEGMPTFINKIREDAVASLPADLQPTYRSKLKSDDSELQTKLVEAASHRPIVRKWTTNDIVQQLRSDQRVPEFASGQAAFRDALCIVCHRIGVDGGVTGPDLTSAGRRFSRDDLLASIVEPSKVVAEQYRGVRVETVNGKVIMGRIASDGDFRETEVRIITDPLAPDKVTVIDKKSIEQFSETSDSPMPTELLNRFSMAEIQDLLAYVQAGGDPKHAVFKKD